MKSLIAELEKDFYYLESRKAQFKLFSFQIQIQFTNELKNQVIEFLMDMYKDFYKDDAYQYMLHFEVAVSHSKIKFQSLFIKPSVPVPSTFPDLRQNVFDYLSHYGTWATLKMMSNFKDKQYNDIKEELLSRIAVFNLQELDVPEFYAGLEHQYTVKHAFIKDKRHNWKDQLVLAAVAEKEKKENVDHWALATYYRDLAIVYCLEDNIKKGVMKSTLAFEHLRNASSSRFTVFDTPSLNVTHSSLHCLF